MTNRNLYLVCNAHLDPVWLWEWEEGVAETLSTFRTAAQLCAEFKEFVFNHNESVLYRWVEEYEPELFDRIRDLVQKKQWHIMGGWFLQPDCNLPGGESFVRQILVGKRYFRDKFGVEPETAVNLDPFGHSRGLVQILKKSGYTAYLFCRPDAEALDLPADDFVWVGYDGSEIMAHRAPEHYNAKRGEARAKVEKWLAENPEKSSGLLLWGIGNHGGGPSREDLENLRLLLQSEKKCRIQHAVPEAYFSDLARISEELPRWKRDLNPWAVGCYTTMTRVKQLHRRLENTYLTTEKMSAHAFLQGLLDYPRMELQTALEDLLFCQFHDILPGSSISEVECSTIQRLNHGLEFLSRLKNRIFFTLLSGQPPAQDGEFPLLVYNHHPFPVIETIICEFQPPEPNLDPDIFWLPEIKDQTGKDIPYQLEKESCNISVDQRKRVAFKAKLEPGGMTRFSCRLQAVAPRFPQERKIGSYLELRSDSASLRINTETGLPDSYQVKGVEFFDGSAFQLLVIKDSPDPWGMKVKSFRHKVGQFSLMTEKESADFAAISAPNLTPVRIIEDGPVRTVVEALFKYGRSGACLRYKFPKQGEEWEVELRVYWNEKDHMLKLSLPTPFKQGRCRGQVAYGVEEFDPGEEEFAAQKWIAVVSEKKNHALTVINDGTYGFDCSAGDLRLSLLRSAAYAAHPVADEIPIVVQDRFEPRIDQGERSYRFWIQGGDAADRLAQVDREALVKNESLSVLCCSPSGKGEELPTAIRLHDDVVQLSAVKLAEDHPWLILRLFEPTGIGRRCKISIPPWHMEQEVKLDAFEIKTLAVDREKKEIFETEQRIKTEK